MQKTRPTLWKIGLEPRMLPTIGLGGAIIGVLDGIAASVNAAARVSGRIEFQVCNEEIQLIEISED